MRSFKLAIGLPLIKRPLELALIKWPLGFAKAAIGAGLDKMAYKLAIGAGQPLINCLCGAIADWASEGEIWGLALLVRADLDKLAIGAGLDPLMAGLDKTAI